MTAITAPLSKASAATPTLAMAAGRNLVAAGAIFGCANLFQWGVFSGALDLHRAWLSVSWLIAVSLFVTLVVRLRRSGGETARRAGSWSRWAILAQVAAALTLAGVSALLGDGGVMKWMSAVGLALYGVAWAIATLRGGPVWMGAVAVGAFGTAAWVALLAGTPTQYLAYAAGLFAFALLPGLALALQRAR